MYFCGITLFLGGGDVSELYNLYRGRYLYYQVRGTDVSIAVGAEYVGGTTYHVSAQVCLDADGFAKTVRVYIANTLQHYPGGYNNHTLMDPAPTAADVYLQPGECEIVTSDITFGSVSWTHQSDIEILAWAQVALEHYPAEIYNAAIMPWPLTHLTPVGDLNCDGEVNSYDIDGFICALSPSCDYEGTYPDCQRALADSNRDGEVNAYDIDSFIDIVGGG